MEIGYTSFRLLVPVDMPYPVFGKKELEKALKKFGYNIHLDCASEYFYLAQKGSKVIQYQKKEKYSEAYRKSIIDKLFAHGIKRSDFVKALFPA